MAALSVGLGGRFDEDRLIALADRLTSDTATDTELQMINDLPPTSAAPNGITERRFIEIAARFCREI